MSDINFVDYDMYEYVHKKPSYNFEDSENIILVGYENQKCNVEKSEIVPKIDWPKDMSSESEETNIIALGILAGLVLFKIMNKYNL